MSQESKCNPAGFVEYVISRAKNKSDTAFQAIMRRADNPNQCSAAWEFLVPFCDLGNDHQRLCFSLVGAAIAREKPENDGSQNLGTALRRICQGQEDAVERESRRLRRLLACDSAQELVPVLRPVVQYIQSMGGASICYQELLTDMIYWSEKTKIKWTGDFYRKNSASEAQGDDSCII